MLKQGLVVVAAVGLCASAARADTWERYGSVRFTDHMGRETQSAGFHGTVDRIRLTAHGSGMVCRRIVAVFGNNNRREIFSGRIRRGQSRVIDLPGHERRVDRLVMVCRATRRGRESGRILVEARAEDRHGRRHRRHRFTWERLGAVIVDDHGDREVESTRDFGRMDRLRFTARHSGVVCRRIVAVFGNGHRRRIFSGRIRRNHGEVVNLPGHERRINRLIMVCRATHRGHDRARLVIHGRTDGQHRRHHGATVCCRKLLFEWTATARQCREIGGRAEPPRACR